MKPTKPYYRTWWFTLLVIVFIFIAMAAYVQIKYSLSMQRSRTVAAEPAAAISAEPVSLSMGEYVVGRDVQPGRYDVVAAGRYGGLMIYYPNGSPYLSVFLATPGSLQNSPYSNRYTNATLKDGMKINTGLTIRLMPK